MTGQPHENLTDHQAATFLSLSSRTLQRMRQIGGGPHYVKIGARVIYRRTDLEDWLASNVVTSTSAATVRDTEAV